MHLGGMIGLAAMLLATTAVAAPNVNLVCDGTRVVTEPGVSKKTVKFHEVYRIDYEANRWCHGTCESVADIIAVTDERITLLQGGGSRLSSDVYIDRVAGKVVGHTKYVTLVADRTNLIDWTATCTPKPFSGLIAAPAPKAQPKF